MHVSTYKHLQGGVNGGCAINRNSMNVHITHDTCIDTYVRTYSYVEGGDMFIGSVPPPPFITTVFSDCIPKRTYDT